MCESPWAMALLSPTSIRNPACCKNHFISLEYMFKYHKCQSITFHVEVAKFLVQIDA